VQDLGFGILICFLFMIFSRVFDVKFGNLHLPGISQRLMVCVIVMTGSFWRSIQSKIGKNYLRFTLWMAMTIPFSVWRGGSFHVLTGQWWAAAVVYMAVGGLISEFRQYRRAVLTLAIAILVLTLICLKFGTMDTGRLFLDHGRFANPNEMAQALLIGMPFWLAISKRSSSLLTKIFSSAVILLMMYIISKTGSRGAAISFGVLYLVLLYHANVMGKVRMLLAGSLFFCAAIAFLPSSLKDRYKTMFSEDTGADVEQPGEVRFLENAVASSESRAHLLRQSLILTAYHPIFGVGPGQFEVAEDQLARAQGKKKGSWLGTHNTYTQISAEMGLPALFFYLSILLLSLKSMYGLFRSTQNIAALREVSIQAEALYLALICLAVTNVFVHSAYTMLLSVLAGLATSLLYTARPLLAKAQSRVTGQPEAAKPAVSVGYRIPQARTV